MLGKIIEVHPDDAYYPNAIDLIGTVWKFDGMFGEPHKSLAGYFMGSATYVGEVPLSYEYVLKGGATEVCTFEKDESTIFHAVKFEILENTGE